MDNIISIFKAKDVDKYPSDEDLQRTLDDLKNVKAVLEQINIESTKITETVDQNQEDLRDSDSSSSKKDEVVESSTQLVNETLRNSIEMLKNGGKFIKPVDRTSKQKKEEEPPADDNKRKSKEIPNENINRPTWSFTSLRNSMTITPIPVSQRKSPPNHKLLTRKASPQALLNRAEKKVKKASKQLRNLERETQTMTTGRDLNSSAPKVISTLHATCRINSYEDKSHTFEIIKPIRVNGHGDGNGNGDKSEIVVVVLANGQTALFTSKSGANILSLAKSQ